MKPPNVILILADQLRFDCLGCNGNPTIQTPILDRLARRGTLFSNPYVCLPVCQPQRVSMMTGHYPSAHGTVHNGIPFQGRFPVLPELLREGGYQTFSSGKLHLNPIAADFNSPPFEPGEVDHLPYMGYERVYSVEGEESDYLRMIKARRPDLWEAANHRPGFTTADPFQAHPTPIPLELHRSTLITDNSIESIHNRDRNRPFFLHCSFWDPHHPFDPPSPYDSLYQPDDMPEPIPAAESYFESVPPHFREWREHLWKTEGKPFNEHSDEDWRRIRALYYGMVSLIDDSVGRLLSCLEDEGLSDDTVIFFTSDHGEILGDHGLCLKGPFFYESLLKVPFIFYDPRRKSPPARIDQPIMSYDLMPTVLDLCGLETPPVNARSLLPLLENGAPPDRPILIEGLDTDMVALIENNSKIVVYRDAAFGELYDLAADPREERNLWEVDKDLRHRMLLSMSRALLKRIVPAGERISLW